MNTTPTETERRPLRDRVSYLFFERSFATLRKEISRETRSFEDAMRNGNHFVDSDGNPTGYKLLQAAYALGGVVKTDEWRYRVYHNNSSSLFLDENKNNYLDPLDVGFRVWRPHEALSAQTFPTKESYRPDVLAVALAEVLVSDNTKLAHLPDSIRNWRTTKAYQGGIHGRETTYLFPVDPELELGVRLTLVDGKRSKEPLPLSTTNKNVRVDFFVHVLDPENRFLEQSREVQKERLIRHQVALLNTESIAAQLSLDLDPNALQSVHNLEYRTAVAGIIEPAQVQEIFKRLTGGEDAEYELVGPDEIRSKNGLFTLKTTERMRGRELVSDIVLTESEQFRSTRRAARLLDLEERIIDLLYRFFDKSDHSGGVQAGDWSALMRVDPKSRDFQRRFRGFEHSDVKSILERLFPLPQSVKDEIQRQGANPEDTHIIESVMIGDRTFEMVFRLTPIYDQDGRPISHISCWPIKGNKNNPLYQRES